MALRAGGSAGLCRCPSGMAMRGPSPSSPVRKVTLEATSSRYPLTDILCPHPSPHGPSPGARGNEGDRTTPVPPDRANEIPDRPGGRASEDDLARGWPATARCRGDIPAWKLSFRSMSTSPISWDGRMWLCCATTAGSPLTARTCRCQFRPRMRWPRCGVCARSSAPCRRACGASARVRGRHRWRP